jgi:hypothetical protein
VNERQILTLLWSKTHSHYVASIANAKGHLSVWSPRDHMKGRSSPAQWFKHENGFDHV